MPRGDLCSSEARVLSAREIGMQLADCEKEFGEGSFTHSFLFAGHERTVKLYAD